MKKENLVMDTKKIALGLVMFSAVANAETVGELRMHSYISYNDSSTVAAKSIVFMKINLAINGAVDPLTPNADNEIESHGHYDYVLSGKSQDFTDSKNKSKSCDFSLLWYQKNGPIMSTKELLDSGIDSNPAWRNDIKLCSGHVLRIESVRKLMIPGSVQNVAVWANGVGLPIFKGELVIKEAPKPDPIKVDDSNDPWHRDH
jgi:hypothetical protein